MYWISRRVQDRVVDPGVGGSEDVVAGPERIGEQEGELGLLEVDDVAEVVGDDVGERDRDEGVRERGGRARRALRSRSTICIPRIPAQKIPVTTARAISRKMVLVSRSAGDG